MKFLVDEDVPQEIVRCLLDGGYEVLPVAGILGKQTEDAEIWKYALKRKAIVVTCNRQDFLKLAGTAPGTGLIILNRRRTRQAECGHILRLVREAGEDGLKNNINFA